VPDGERRPILLGVSLKLYLDITQSSAWARGVAELARGSEPVRRGDVRLFALPSLPALPAVRDALAGSGVAVGAQDLHWEDRGAFTGAVSGADLVAAGCTYVEVGHAERRRIFGDDDAAVAAKLAAALRNGLVPVLCVGEPVRVDPAAAADECRRQLDAALARLDDRAPGADLVVAYEPEWAIGRAEPAAPEHVRAVAFALRAALDDDPRVASASIIYGGSAGRGLLRELGDAVDGLFLGRRAHDPADLAAIVEEAIAIP
jgi:triosephosphate isomerase